MSNKYIVTTTRHERFIECIKKGVYGLSEGMLRKLGSFLKSSSENDILFLKLSSTPQMLAGPFNITERPKDLSVKKAWGKCFKVDTGILSKNIPWWVAEGYDCLIFFKQSPDSKFAEISEETQLPNLGYLPESLLDNLLKYLDEKGKPLKELINDRSS